MRVRALTATRDYSFGRGATNFLVDSAAMVRQRVSTRLKLLQGEWYLDETDGTPWLQEVLDKGHSQTYDLVIQNRILGTPGVSSISQYQSQLDTVSRGLSVACLIYTIYSTDPISLEETL